MGATKKAAKLFLVLAGCVALTNGQTTTTTTKSTAATVETPEAPATTKAVRPTVAPVAPSAKRAAGTPPSSDTSAPNPEETIEDIVYTGPLPQDCVSPDVKYTSEVLTDFIPVYREARQCQQACQAHGECYFWTWHEGKAGSLQSIPEAGEEIELFVPEYSYAESQRRALGFADHTPVSKAAPRMRSLQTKRPTADEVLAAPPAGACFLFGPYVKTSTAEMHISGPRTCADECSALYSANCKYSRCCSRATATCVSKDSFFSQCRLPTDACPGRGWNCYNVSSTPLGCLEYDTEYAPDVFGNDLEEILDVPTELHCQELCKNHAKCSYWSYNPWYKHMCLLKKKNRPKRASKGIISGTKECAGFSQPETLYYLEEAPEYSTFYALLQKAGLVSYVEERTAKATNGTGGITLLVPTNRAFEALPTTVERKLKSSDALLKKLMLYHMIDKPIWIERTIGDKTFTAVKSASGDDIGLSRRASAGGNLRINDADVLIMDLRTRDGMLNLITDVLIPPSLAEEADGSLDSLNGQVSGQGVASLLEGEPAADKDASSTAAKPTAPKTTAPKKTTTTTTTTPAPKKTTTTKTTTTVEPTTTTTTTTVAPPKTTNKRPIIDDDASTIMDSVNVADPTATPEGTMPTTGMGAQPTTDDKTSVETSDRDVPGVQNDNVEASSDNTTGMGTRGVTMEEEPIMEEAEESNGVLGMGMWLDIVILILVLALLAAAIGAAFMWNKKKQAAKSLESEVAATNATNARVEYGSR